MLPPHRFIVIVPSSPSILVIILQVQGSQSLRFAPLLISIDLARLFLSSFPKRPVSKQRKGIGFLLGVSFIMRVDLKLGFSREVRYQFSLKDSDRLVTSTSIYATVSRRM